MITKVTFGILIGLLIGLSFKFELLSADENRISFNHGILWNSDRGLNPNLLKD